jgi:hypothetical protein
MMAGGASFETFTLLCLHHIRLFFPLIMARSCCRSISLTTLYTERSVVRTLMPGCRPAEYRDHLYLSYTSAVTLRAKIVHHIHFVVVAPLPY